MSLPRVYLKKIERKKGYVYRLDFRFNGVRRREVIGSNKREAELIKAKIERDLLYGEYDIPSPKELVPFTKLVDEYFIIKKNNLSKASITRLSLFIYSSVKIIDNFTKEYQLI